MADPIVRRDVTAQPILLIRRTIARAALAETLGACFGELFSLGHARGLPVAGGPMARYTSMDSNLWTIEAIMPLSSPVSPDSLGNPDIEAGHLYGGPVAFAVHHGEYQTLPQTHAAIEQWIRQQGYSVGGAPWESYITDPGRHTDPSELRTEVYWPLKLRG